MTRFLIYNYWRHHRRQLIRVCFPILLLVMILLVSILLERTECRRAFEKSLYNTGAQSMMFQDLPADALTDLEQATIVSKSGNVLIAGKLGDTYQQYTYGCYLDEDAEMLEHLKLLYGRMPQESGEAAVCDIVLSDLFHTVDPSEYLGQEVTLQRYAFDGETNLTGTSTGTTTIRIVGIIETNQLRENKEYTNFWQGYSDQSIISLPIIYLHPSDCTASETSHTITLMQFTDGDVVTETQNKRSNDWILSFYETHPGIFGIGGGGILTAAESVANYQANNPIYSQISFSDTMVIIGYFSIVAIVVSAISLFGILGTVMTERMQSLHTLQKLGATHRQVWWILLWEWIMFLVSGVVAGLVLGLAVYEGILWAQAKWMGLSPLQGFQVEWAVEQVTRNPWYTAIGCAAVMLAIGYLLYFLCQHRWLQRKRKRSGVRGFLFIRRKLAGKTRNAVMQVLCIALTITTSAIFYAYCTSNGKGDGYFTEESNVKSQYYTYGGVQLDTADVDICLYTSGRESQGLSVLQDIGVPAETLAQIEALDGVELAEGYVVNETCNFYYSKDAQVPSILRGQYAELAENASELLHPSEREYYSVPGIFLSDSVLSRLESYLLDGAIGVHENGIVLLVSQAYDIAELPIAVGETVQSIAVDGSRENAVHDNSLVVDAVAYVPESVQKTDPTLYRWLGATEGVKFAAPLQTAISQELYNYDYDTVYLQLEANANSNQVTAQLQTLLDSSMKVAVRTIAQCDQAYLQYQIEQYASILILFTVLILMMVTGYVAMLTTDLHANRKQVGVLRALGMPEGRWRRFYLCSNLWNTLLGCILGILCSYGVQWWIGRAYQQALAVFGYPEQDLIMADADQYQIVNTLVNRYLLESEIWNAPLLGALLVLSGVMLVLSCGMILGISRRKTSAIIEEIRTHKEG